MKEINGKEIARSIVEELKKKITPKRFLGIFFVAPDEAAKIFLNQKKKIADELGVDFRLYEFPIAITQDELRKEIEKVVLGAACGGAIVQLPLPGHINAQYVLNAIPREKDVDVLGERALGAFAVERNPVLPTAVETVLEVLKAEKRDVEDSTVAVVGIGKLVGRPVVSYFERKAKNIFALDKRGDFPLLLHADIVVLGAGDPGIVTPEILKEGALVIDFGYGQKNGKTMGDFDSITKINEATSRKLTYTPTPGGTGPILVAKLFENFYTLAGIVEPRKKPSFFKG